MRAIRVAVMGLAMAVGAAQAAGDGATAVPDPKKAVAPADKKKPPAKDAARAPAKVPAKKPAAAPKKAPPEAKKPVVEAGKPAATGDPNVKIYKANDPNAPKVRDKQGNVIPTSPDAYDISSALKK